MHKFTDAEDLAEYIAHNKIDGYLMVAISGPEAFLAFGYDKCPDALLDVVDGMMTEIELSRTKDD